MSIKAIWNSCIPIPGSIAEAYFIARNVSRPKGCNLRAINAYPHPHSAQMYPAIVSQLNNGLTARPMGLALTFVSQDGRSLTNLKPRQLSIGNNKGGAVFFGLPHHTLAVGISIETCLRNWTKHHVPTWATLTLGGLNNLKLDRGIAEVTILLERPDSVYVKAAQDAAARWRSEGKLVWIDTGADPNTLYARWWATTDAIENHLITWHRGQYICLPSPAGKLHQRHFRASQRSGNR